MVEIDSFGVSRALWGFFFGGDVLFFLFLGGWGRALETPKELISERAFLTGEFCTLKPIGKRAKRPKLKVPSVIQVLHGLLFIWPLRSIWGGTYIRAFDNSIPKNLH